MTQSLRQVTAFAVCVSLAGGCIWTTDTSEITAADVASDVANDVPDDTAGDADAISDVEDDTLLDDTTPDDVIPDVVDGPRDPCVGGAWCDEVSNLLVSCAPSPVATSCTFGCDDGACLPECATAFGCSEDATSTVDCNGGVPTPDDMCPEGFACTDGGCNRTDECEPGSTRCVEGGIMACDQTGSLSVFVPCGDAACTPVWPDVDGDDWGDGFVPIAVACGVPEGMADNDLDCDDAAPSDSTTPCPGWSVVEPGSFLMGTPEGELAAVPSNEVQQAVEVTRRLLVMQTEVTQDMWVARSAASGNPSFHAECPTCPVEMVSWFDALRFANEMSRSEGLELCYTLGECPPLEYGTGCADEEQGCEALYACDRATFRGLDCEGYRLPAEFEWEYFTRAGETGPYPAVLETVGWFRDSPGEDETHPVAMLNPNAFGLYDVHGNVHEWVMDVQEAYRGDLVTPTLDPLAFGTPTDVTAGANRVNRGGAFNTSATQCRAAARAFVRPTTRNWATGFRLVRTFGAD